MLRFTIMTIALALLIKGCVMSSSLLGWFSPPSFSNVIIVFFGLSTVGLYRFVVNRLGLRPQDFVRTYLAATILRILFFGGFAFVVMRLDRPEARHNALFFLVCYFLFTALEVLILFRQVNYQNPTRRGQKDT